MKVAQIYQSNHKDLSQRVRAAHLLLLPSRWLTEPSVTVARVVGRTKAKTYNPESTIAKKVMTPTHTHSKYTHIHKHTHLHVHKHTYAHYNLLIHSYLCTPCLSEKDTCSWLRICTCKCTGHANLNGTNNLKNHKALYNLEVALRSLSKFRM